MEATPGIEIGENHPLITDPFQDGRFVATIRHSESDPTHHIRLVRTKVVPNPYQEQLNLGQSRTVQVSIGSCP
jgi:hypothetical protein